MRVFLEDMLPSLLHALYEPYLADTDANYYTASLDSGSGARLVLTKVSLPNPSALPSRVQMKKDLDLAGEESFLSFLLSWFIRRRVMTKPITCLCADIGQDGRILYIM